MTTTNSPRKFLTPPVFPEDENKTRQAYYLSVSLPVAVLILLLIIITRLRQGDALLGNSTLTLATIAGVLCIAWAVVKRGAVRLAAIITITALSIASTYVAVSANGIRGVGYMSYFVVMVLAGLWLLSHRHLPDE